jgi:hypothetical protein
MSWYSIEGDDGFPRAMHAVKDKPPAKAREISEAEAAQISRDVRAREPKPAAVTQSVAGAPPIDLTSIRNQLDEHEAKIAATQASVSAYLLGVKSGVTA